MTHRIHIETAGCAFNASDSEAMAGVLSRAGFEISKSPDAADIVILNSCTVKDKTFRSFKKRLDQWRAGDGQRNVIVAGCIPKAYERTDLLREVSTLGPDCVGRVDEVVRETLRGRVVHLLSDAEPKSRSSLPTLRRNPIIEILPIARGCLSACTFCQTRIARGRLISFPHEEILAQARRAIDEGVKIFWVTGQDTGAYGHDIDYPLPRLLEGLLDQPGSFQVRLGMSSPQWIAERLDEYLELFSHPKIFRFLHVPLQSGSNRILAHMKRDGGVSEFRKIHAAFMGAHPDCNFVTDLIVGYPEETDEDFNQTLALVEELQLGFINVSKFSPRPGTAAARLKPLQSAIVTRRCKELMNAVRVIAEKQLAMYCGIDADVTIEQVNEEACWGRTASYRPVEIRGCGDVSPPKLGDRLKIKITGSEQFHLTGEA